MKRFFQSLPIRWQMTFWAFLLLFSLFIFYNFVQFYLLQRWFYQLERDAANAKGEEILFFLSQQGVKEPSDLQRIRPLLYRFLDENQTVKIMNRKGEILLTLQENENQMNEGAQMNQESSFFDLFDWLRGKEEGLDFWNGETHFLSIRRKISLGNVQGVVEIINRMDRYDQFMKQFFLLMLGGTGIASLLSLLGGAWLARKLLTPIRSLSDAMQRIGRGGFHERVPVKENHDELSRLSIAFNQMMDRVEESFLKQKQFVEDASHELRTPLAAIEGHLSLLERWGKEEPEVLNESLKASLFETKRLKRLVNELLEVSRAEREGEEEYWTDPLPILQQIERNFRSLYPEVTLHTDLKVEGICLPVRGEHLEQILYIFLENAVKYSEDEKEVSLTASLEGDRCLISVSDRGIGIAKEDLPYIFDRFYRADKARSSAKGGYGLGLAIAKRLVERSGGSIKVNSQLSKGTRIEVGWRFERQKGNHCTSPPGK